MLEMLGVVGELAGIHPPGRLQEGGFFFADRCDPDVLGSAGDDGHVLIGNLATAEGQFRLGKLLQLAGDAHTFHGGTGRQPAPVAKPCHERDGAVRFVFPGFIEPPEAIGEDRLILSLQESGKAPAPQGRDVYIAWMGERAYATEIRAAKDLRNAGFRVELPPTELKFGKALERATKLGSRFALILGDNEVADGQWTLKTLADGSQQKLTEQALLEYLRR